ncbi:hypothetical protein F2P56_017740 [Juglans regia]|uniref:Uncharacterized protein LOC109008954 n=2 Tax=Juglans regia TaxID=51240 RepID=A0A2I4GLN0_JUGRE|nr:uncharacterized protein LOC109008954 [Juglans regia]KAF5461662.1 hypothetical protein F2P56_017740 [Juglans regia]
MAATNKISLKLFIDKKRNRVLFAEAGKDFVDFLFQSFTLPVVTVTSFLKSEDMLGCLQNLYESIENPSHNCIQPGQSKEDLVLKPKLVMSGATDSLLLPRVESSYTFRKLYKCSNNSCSSRDYELSSIEGAYCNSCSSSLVPMRHEVSLSELTSANKAISNFNLLKEWVRFIVMDDLWMMLMSADAFITLLHEYDIKDLRALEKRVVDLDMHGSVKLLKAALQSKTALTDVFLSSSPSKNSRTSEGKDSEGRSLSE